MVCTVWRLGDESPDSLSQRQHFEVFAGTSSQFFSIGEVRGDRRIEFRIDRFTAVIDQHTLRWILRTPCTFGAIVVHGQPAIISECVHDQTTDELLDRLTTSGGSLRQIPLNISGEVKLHGHRDSSRYCLILPQLGASVIRFLERHSRYAARSAWIAAWNSSTGIPSGQSGEHGSSPERAAQTSTRVAYVFRSSPTESALFRNVSCVSGGRLTVMVTRRHSMVMTLYHGMRHGSSPFWRLQVSQGPKARLIPQPVLPAHDSWVAATRCIRGTAPSPLDGPFSGWRFTPLLFAVNASPDRWGGQHYQAEVIRGRSVIRSPSVCRDAARPHVLIGHVKAAAGLFQRKIGSP